MWTRIDNNNGDSVCLICIGCIESSMQKSMNKWIPLSIHSTMHHNPVSLSLCSSPWPNKAHSPAAAPPHQYLGNVGALTLSKNIPSAHTIPIILIIIISNGTEDGVIWMGLVFRNINGIHHTGVILYYSQCLISADDRWKNEIPSNPHTISSYVRRMHPL